MRTRFSLTIVAVAAVVLAMLAVLPALAAEGEAGKPRPLEVTLERAAELLDRLDSELAAVDRPAAERLAMRVEEASGLVADLLAALETENPTPSPRAQATRLDLTLHRLVALLEEFVGDTAQRPERAKARMTLEELRAWVDGYVASAAAGMNARDAERFDRAAHDLARALAARLARVAKKAPATESGTAGLPKVIERLEALTSRLDAMLLEQATKTSSEATKP
jgi:hypothetical protein